MRKLLLCNLLLLVINISAQNPGDLYLPFGISGIVTTNLAAGFENLSSMIVQPDGKIIVVGNKDESNLKAFLIARFFSDGSIDDSFGNGGLQVLPLLGNCFPEGSVLQPDGKILVAGFIEYFGGEALDYRFVILRLNSDGTPDLTFGAAGTVITPVGTSDLIGYDGQAFDITVQEDNKILLVGRALNGEDYDYAVVRYNQDGVIDNEFGDEGQVLVDWDNLSDYGYEVEVLTSGKIILAGVSYTEISTELNVSATALNSDGTIDTNFGNGGILLIETAEEENYITDMIISDNKIYVSTKNTLDGYSVSGLYSFLDNGTMNLEFGSNGVIINDFLSFGVFIIKGMAAQGDGKFLVGGTLLGINESMIRLIRYNSDGSVDESFGTAGTVVSDFTFSAESLSDIQLDDNGLIIICGNVQASDQLTLIAKYHSELTINLMSRESTPKAPIVKPNPISPTSTIEFNLSENSNLSLSLVDVKGSEVLRLCENKNFPSGTHEIPLEPLASISPGSYFLIMEISRIKYTTKLVIEWAP